MTTDFSRNNLQENRYFAPKYFEMIVLIVSIATGIVGLGAFALYSSTWKKNFPRRNSKLEEECISNSVLKYTSKKRKSLEETKPIPILLKDGEKEICLNEEREAPGLSIDHLHLGLCQQFIMIDRANGF